MKAYLLFFGLFFCILLTSSCFSQDAKSTETKGGLNPQHEYLIIESKDNPKLQYTYIKHYPVWSTAHDAHPSMNIPPMSPKLTQSDLDRIDYSKITLQALDGEAFGLKFVHSSSNPRYPVSSWILPKEIGSVSDKAEVGRIAKHRRIGSIFHSRENTECDTMPHFVRVIQQGGKEAVATYGKNKNNKYGFFLYNNLLTPKDLERIKYKKISLVDVDADHGAEMNSHNVNRSRWHGRISSIFTHYFLVTRGID